MENKELIRGLAALAQDSRLAIFRLLLQRGPEGMIVSKIADALDLAPATLSFHLKELSIAGLVSARQEGRFIHYSADFDAMNELVDCLTQNCCVGSGDRNCLASPVKAKRTITISRRKAVA